MGAARRRRAKTRMSLYSDGGKCARQHEFHEHAAEVMDGPFFCFLIESPILDWYEGMVLRRQAELYGAPPKFDLSAASDDALAGQSTKE